ncbi:hypothetical protein GW755_02170 [bacterium]|nr:hypothetical protein [bacterium]
MSALRPTNNYLLDETAYYPEEESPNSPTLNPGSLWILDELLDSNGGYTPKKLLEVSASIQSKDEFDVTAQVQTSLAGFYRTVFGVLRGEDLRYLFTDNQLRNLGLTGAELSGTTCYDGHSLYQQIDYVFTHYCAAKGIPPNLLPEEVLDTLSQIINAAHFSFEDNPFNDNPYNLPGCFDPKQTNFYPGLTRCINMNFPTGSDTRFPYFRIWVYTPMILSDQDRLGSTRYFLLDSSPPSTRKKSLVGDMRILMTLVSGLLAIEEDCLKYKRVSLEPWVQMSPELIGGLIEKYRGHFHYLKMHNAYNRPKNNFSFLQIELSDTRIKNALYRLAQFANFMQQNPILYQDLVSGNISVELKQDSVPIVKTSKKRSRRKKAKPYQCALPLYVPK